MACPTALVKVGLTLVIGGGSFLLVVSHYASSADSHHYPIIGEIEVRFPGFIPIIPDSLNHGCVDEILQISSRKGSRPLRKLSAVNI